MTSSALLDVASHQAYTRWVLLTEMPTHHRLVAHRPLHHRLFTTTIHTSPTANQENERECPKQVNLSERQLKGKPIPRFPIRLV